MTTQQDPNDCLKPWARWLVNHRMRFIVVALAWLSLPWVVLAYLPEAIADIRSVVRSLK